MTVSFPKCPACGHNMESDNSGEWCAFCDDSGETQAYTPLEIELLEAVRQLRDLCETPGIVSLNTDTVLSIIARATHA